jgi:hypothetical protein
MWEPRPTRLRWLASAQTTGPETASAGPSELDEPMDAGEVMRREHGLLAGDHALAAPIEDARAEAAPSRADRGASSATENVPLYETALVKAASIASTDSKPVDVERDKAKGLARGATSSVHLNPQCFKAEDGYPSYFALSGQAQSRLQPNTSSRKSAKPPPNSQPTQAPVVPTTTSSRISEGLLTRFMTPNFLDVVAGHAPLTRNYQHDDDDH